MEKKGFIFVNYSCFVFLIVTVLFFLTVVNVNAQKAPKPQYGGTLVQLSEQSPRTPIGWPSDNRPLGNPIFQPTLETLIIEDNSGKIHPWLAESMKVAPDHSSITFILRKGVRFHDGSDFNAEAVRFNLQAAKDSKKPGTRYWKSIEIVDNYTIRINLTKYTNTMVPLFTVATAAMVSPKAFKEKGLEWIRWNQVGTGPFKMVSYKRDVNAKFIKNEDYWQKGKPYLDGIEVKYIKDPLTLLAAFKSGEGHVITYDWGKLVADLKAAGFKANSGSTGVVCLMPDSKNPNSPFSKKSVREAVSYALDREAIVKARGFGMLNAAYQLANKISSAYDPNFKGRRYDPEKAKKLLTEAGYPNGFETKLIPMGRGTDKDIMIAIQSYLGAVGIKVDVDFVPHSKYAEFRMKGWHNGLLCQPVSCKPNLNQSIESYFSVNSPQYPSMKRVEGFQKLLEESVSTTDMDTEKTKKVIRKISDEAMIIPVHETGRAFLMRDNIHDTGHMEWGAWPNWRAGNTWIGKK